MYTEEELLANAVFDEWIGDYVISWDNGVQRKDGARFVSNPYALDVHGVVSNDWMTEDEYYEACQDI